MVRNALIVIVYSMWPYFLDGADPPPPGPNLHRNFGRLIQSASENISKGPTDRRKQDFTTQSIYLAFYTEQCKHTVLIMKFVFEKIYAISNRSAHAGLAKRNLPYGVSYQSHGLVLIQAVKLMLLWKPFIWEKIKNCQHFDFVSTVIPGF